MPPTDPQRARRRDAEENRARIVAAAREVFAADGFDAPLDAIARRAGSRCSSASARRSAAPASA